MDLGGVQLESQLQYKLFQNFSQFLIASAGEWFENNSLNNLWQSTSSSLKFVIMHISVDITGLLALKQKQRR